jgi:hypothetical protein
VFSPNIRGVFSGARFYEIEVNGQTLNLEEPLSEIEGRNLTCTLSLRPIFPEAHIFITSDVIAAVSDQAHIGL